MQSRRQYKQLARTVEAHVKRTSERRAQSKLASQNIAGAIFDDPSAKEQRVSSAAESSHDISSSTEDNQHAYSSKNIDLEKSLPPKKENDNAAAETPLARKITTKDALVVRWDGPDDPLSPRNWTTPRRILVTSQISLIAFVIIAASGIDAAVLPQAAADFGVSETVESLATGLFLAGMGFGSLIAGPFSETFGRNLVYLFSMAIFMIWIMAAALSPNIGAQLAFRFLAGCSGSTPLVCSGGSIADMFNSTEKTWAFPLYAIPCFGAPMLGAVMGAYIGPSTLVSWRWSEWTLLIFAGLVLVIIVLLMPETFAPILLEWKAQHMRRVTGDQRYRSEHELADTTLVARLKVSMGRPFLMFTEPIILTFSVYLTVAYIVLFTFLIGWPNVFQYTYGLSQGLSNVIFVAMFVGTWLAFILVPIVYWKTLRLMRSKGAEDATQLEPECRLYYGMWGASVGLPVSLFWLAWTDFSSVSIWSPILAVTLFGWSTMGIFICTYMYVIDSYGIYSASALTLVALVRYVVAGGVTVVGIPFYHDMGTHYTLTILACISSLLVPAPYLFYYYGPWLRGRSKYIVTEK